MTCRRPLDKQRLRPRARGNKPSAPPSSVFGINIHVALYRTPNTFWVATAGMLGGAAALFVVAILYYRNKVCCCAECLELCTFKDCSNLATELVILE